MTKLLDQAIAKLRALPSDRQEDAAELLLSLVDHDPQALHLTDAQVAEVERRLQAPAETLSHDCVEIFFQKQTM